jgi:hypothetical protein|tara:strand:+ start:202 stop:636 length:435 start_codon:yes stop_codon:yes gene_type:complete
VSDAISFLGEHKLTILGGIAIGFVFRNQLSDMASKIMGSVSDSKAAELVFRPKPLDEVWSGRTTGQIRTERDGNLKMSNRGRAVGQTIASNPATAISESPVSMANVHDPNMDTTLWEGKFTDAALKYTVSSFGSNYSGSAIGVQ